MPYQCYTKCFDALVCPIINYGASIWGTRSFSCIEAVLNRACRFFMGLGRYAPNCGIQGDMGWTPVLQDQWAAVTRQWCHLVNMNNRITKYIFMYHELCKNWNFRVKQFYQSIGLHYLCNTNGTYDIPPCVNNIKKVILCVSQMNKHGLIR